MTIEEFRQIYRGLGTSFMLTEEFENKLVFNTDIRIPINKELTIEKYSNVVKEFCLIYMALPPGKAIQRADKLRFSRKYKMLDLFVNMDIARLEKATQQEALQMMCELYLESIEKYLTKRKDFDAKRYYQDVKEVFVKHEFIKA